MNGLSGYGIIGPQSAPIQAAGRAHLALSNLLRAKPISTERRALSMRLLLKPFGGWHDPLSGMWADVAQRDRGVGPLWGAAEPGSARPRTPWSAGQAPRWLEQACRRVGPRQESERARSDRRMETFLHMEQRRLAQLQEAQKVLKAKDRHVMLAAWTAAALLMLTLVALLLLRSAIWP